jgi:phage terminase small subunit
MATNGNLTARQRRLIGALMTSANVAAAAATAGIPERSAYRWMKQREFRAELDAATKDAIAQTVRRLASLSVAATGTLAGAMSDAPTSDRIRAAGIVLARLPQLAQLFALEDRLAAVEEVIARGDYHAVP